MICGHIHRAEITEIDGVLYCNDGDWVESCTTLVEDFAGRLSLLRWTENAEVLVGTQPFPFLDGAMARRAGGMKLAIVTDAWLPQINGVVRTLTITVVKLSQPRATKCTSISPADFRTFPCPTYPEIRLSLFAGTKGPSNASPPLDPDAVHIATEGPLGLAARRWCLRRGCAFTTSYHTRFPEYLRARVPIPLSVSYAFLRWFHGKRNPHTRDHSLDAPAARSTGFP